MLETLRALLAVVAVAAAAAHAQVRPMVVLVGDSTMAARNGYGDALCQRLEPEIGCVNFARNGRSTRSYRDEGLWTQVLSRMPEWARSGRIVMLIQFGHNDQPGKPGRSTDLATEYPVNLERYVSEARDGGAVPVLVTPLTRRVFRGAALDDDLAPWAQAMRDVARRLGVPLIDLYASSRTSVQALGPDAADELAMAARGEPGFDHTHLGERGASLFAGLVLRELRPLLAASGTGGAR